MLVDTLRGSPRYFVRQPAVFLMTLITLNFAPFFVLHYLDLQRLYWKVGGGSRALIQTNLIRKFLNYSQDARIDLRGGELFMGIAKDTFEIVHEGYINLLKLIKNLFTLVAVLVFQVALVLEKPYGFGKPTPYEALSCLVIFPLYLLVILRCRRAKTSKTLKTRNDSEMEVIDGSIDIMNQYRMIADYGKRPEAVDDFAKSVGVYNKDRVSANVILMNNRYFAIWFTEFILAAFMIYQGMQVLVTPTLLSVYLANIKCIKLVGKAWGDIYEILIEVEATFPSLYRVIHLMNKETDVTQRKELNRVRRRMTGELRKELLENPNLKGLPVDNLPIKVKNFKLTMEIPGAGGKGSGGFTCPGEMILHQGRVIAFIGPHGHGKSKILGCLGNMMLLDDKNSDSETIAFVPSHLRVLHLCSEPIFLDKGLYENLTFGVAKSDPDANKDRVKQICRMLGIDDPRILDMIDEDELQPAFNEVLSQAERQQLSLARAFIANTELMCLHKPLVMFTEETREKVLVAFRTYVREKGLVQDLTPKVFSARRPRTLIFTTGIKSKDAEKYCDQIWEISSKGMDLRHPPPVGR